MNGSRLRVVLLCVAGAALLSAGDAGAQVAEVRALAIAPRDPMTLYALTNCAGIIKTTDGGTSWMRVSSFGGFGTSLAVDPSDSETIYAGNSGLFNGGVFKSTDGGASWAAVLGTPSVITLAIDPVSPQTLYAAGIGVFKSADGGNTWSAADTGLPGSVVSALAIDPATPSTLYAGTSFPAAVFKSTDGGGRWTAMNDGLPGDERMIESIEVLAIAPSDPQVVYATKGRVLEGGGVFKSTDGGASWTAMNEGLEGAIHALAIDPEMPATLYAGAGDSETTPMFKSTDGGRTWGALSSGDAPRNVRILAFDAATPPTLYAADPFGLFKSIDGGAGWRRAGLDCGDGLVCNEECDDGNSIDGDGCDHNCRPTACGNAVVTAAEQCDDGNLSPCDGCSDTCRIEVGYVCGDGVANASCGEQCDDGNRLSCDGCSVLCQAEPGFRCGDGAVNTTCGEQCDDGNPQSGDGCDANCTLTRCGNGIVTPGEQCDDANADSSDGCTSACTICGNEIVTPPEECDDGNADPADDCSNACTHCGNGVLDGDEECDDANTSGGDGCASNCTVESAHSIALDPSRSGIEFQGTTFPSSPLLQGSHAAVSGRLTLRVGKARETAEGHEMPLAVRPRDLLIDPVRVGVAAGGLCLCLSAIEDSALGEGIAGSGTVSCGGPLPAVELLSSIDHNTDDVDPACATGVIEAPGLPHQGVCNGPEAVTASGMGPSGSARLDLGVRSYQIFDGGTCAVETSTQICDNNGCLPAKGADGMPCTEDDPVPGASGNGSFFAPPLRFEGEEQLVPIISLPTPPRLLFLPSQFELRLTTGTARVEIRDADNALGNVVGTGSCGSERCIGEATGSVLDCSALDRAEGGLAGGALAAAFGTLHGWWSDTDAVTTLVFGAAVCAGDCDASGNVRINELVTLVNIGLESALPSACPSGVPIGEPVGIALIVQAVNNGLVGCGSAAG